MDEDAQKAFFVGVDEGLQLNLVQGLRIVNDRRVRHLSSQRERFSVESFKNPM